MEKYVTNEKRSSRYAEEKGVNEFIDKHHEMKRNQKYKESHPSLDVIMINQSLAARKEMLELTHAFPKVRQLNEWWLKDDYTSRKTNSFGIPRYAIAEVIALIIGVVASLAIFIIDSFTNPMVAKVFLIPLFASLFGIIFVIVKKP